MPSLTVLRANAVEADRTDAIYSVGNGEFLQAVFGAALGEARPVVVSFNGDPTKAPSKAWFGQPWGVPPETSGQLSAAANNYFSLAAFRPDEAGQYRRKKVQFHALHAVMLDDVGTKVAPERLTLPPSWTIETSPGNYQAGYMLREPLHDGGAADRLMDAIVGAGLCDPGAGGPQARLARLPVATNGKHFPPFSCRLINWRPELRYSRNELADGLQLEVQQAARTVRPKGRAVQEKPSDGDAVWLPRPAENGVLAAIRGGGLYKAPLGQAKHDITCPWAYEHTGAVDSGTAYFEPNDTWPIGGFNCMHGHCAHRHIRDLLQFLHIEPGDARMKPRIRVVAGEINRILDAAERELADSGRYYQRGGQIVTVITDPGTHETRVQGVSQPALVRALAGAATWERFDGRAGDWGRIDPPTRHAAVLLDSTAYHHLPVLNGLARQPYLRPDGSLMSGPGYDLATGMFGDFDAHAFAVPVMPTRQEAMASLGVLQELLAEFSFASDTDRAAALSAILTAAVRASLAHAPMFHVQGHMVGSGKSYLCKLITAFATPQLGTPTTFPSDDDECRKLLLAELMRAPAVIEFDNLTGDLVAHKSLCTALTSEHMTGRILGLSKTATVNTRVLILSSGNNVGPVQDMTRRCITIHLSPDCEVPAARTFARPELVQDLLRERGQHVSAALTIVRAWLVAGRPIAHCKALAGYSGWSDLCRQPLLWLGLPDPTASVYSAIAEDPDRETLGRLLIAWHSAFGKTAAMVRDAMNLVLASPNEHAELREVIHDIAGERDDINRRKLGWWVKRHAGQIVNGRRFARASGTRSAEAWQVQVVLSVSSVPALSSTNSVEVASDRENAYELASRGA